jgi:membrane protein required for colicin V production
MELSYFDLVVGIIILLLGLKGIINGFFKELFGLIGIIGGIFVASRLGDSVGRLISDSIFKFESQAAVSFVGFVSTLIIFWAGMIILGLLLTRLSRASGLGPIDKMFGFIVGSGKFFLIGAVIAYALYNVQAIRVNLQPAMKNSVLFPVMVAAGSFIMHIDPVEVSKDLNDTVDEGLKTAQEKIDTAKESVSKKVDDTIEQSAEKIKKSVKEHIETNTTKGE